MSKPDEAVSEVNTYITFLECQLRGHWGNLSEEDSDNPAIPVPAEFYHAMASDGELWLVRLDQLRVALLFKQDSEIIIRGNTVIFKDSDVSEELIVNEDEQFGLHQRK